MLYFINGRPAKESDVNALLIRLKKGELVSFTAETKENRIIIRYSDEK